MKTGAAYIRVSTEDQTEYSPDSQLKKIREYAAAHEILLPEHLIFLDEGISGRSASRRPAFLRMIGMAKQKPRPFDLILVWKFSRFARSRQDSILYKSMLRKDCGIHVISITEQLSDDPTAILIEALLEAMDEYYSINLAQEVRRGMNEKFSRGGVVSVPPFGYRMGTECFVPDAEKSFLVPMIFEDCLNGLTCRQIAVKLNRLGIRTARGNPFESRTVQYILTNPTYTGKLRRRTGNELSSDRSPSPSMRTVDGRHPALIDAETFRRVQEQIGRQKEKAPVRTGTSSACYMLRGLVRCSRCGSALTPAEKGRSLQCRRYAKGLCATSHHIRLEKLNRAVLTGLEADLSGGACEQIRVQIDKPAASGRETAVFSRLLEQESRRLSRIQEAYESGADSLEEYQEHKARIAGRIRELEEEILRQNASSPQAAPHVQFSLKQIPALLARETISETAKNELLRTFLSHIIFYRPEKAVRIYYRL